MNRHQIGQCTSVSYNYHETGPNWTISQSLKLAALLQGIDIHTQRNAFNSVSVKSETRIFPTDCSLLRGQKLRIRICGDGLQNEQTNRKLLYRSLTSSAMMLVEPTSSAHFRVSAQDWTLVLHGHACQRLRAPFVQGTGSRTNVTQPTHCRSCAGMDNIRRPAVSPAFLALPNPDRFFIQSTLFMSLTGSRSRRLTVEATRCQASLKTSA